MNGPLWILLANAGCTLFLAGLIWTVQLVHYPSFSFVSESRFVEFESFHQRRISFVVMPAMLIEAGTGLLLLAYRPALIPMWVVVAAAGLLAVIWVSTFLLQVPLHTRLSESFDAASARALVQTNWIRTAAWTARSALMLFALVLVLNGKGPVN